jgi:uncharacterized repeat protein (TIGR01451 family)
VKWHGGLGRSLGRVVALLAAAAVMFSVGPSAGLAESAFRAAEPESSDAADLAVEITDSSDPVKLGEDFHYNVRVRNLGPADATDVRLKDALPETFELVSATGAKSCEGTNDVYCELGDIPHSGAQTVVLHVRATTPGTFDERAKAEAEQDDPEGDNNSATESTQVLGRDPDPQTAARLVVVAHVVNDDGGTASARDFAVAVEGVDAKPSAFPGDEDGMTVALGAGAYDVRVLPRPGYETTLSPECAGTIAAGEARKCAATLDDLAPLALTLSTDSTQVGPGSRDRPEPLGSPAGRIPLRPRIDPGRHNRRPADRRSDADVDRSLRGRCGRVVLAPARRGRAECRRRVHGDDECVGGRAVHTRGPGGCRCPRRLVGGRTAAATRSGFPAGPDAGPDSEPRAGARRPTAAGLPAER